VGMPCALHALGVANRGSSPGPRSYAAAVFGHPAATSATLNPGKLSGLGLWSKRLRPGHSGTVERITTQPLYGHCAVWVDTSESSLIAACADVLSVNGLSTGSGGELRPIGYRTLLGREGPLRAHALFNAALCPGDSLTSLDGHGLLAQVARVLWSQTGHSCRHTRAQYLRALRLDHKRLGRRSGRGPIFTPTHLNDWPPAGRDWRDAIWPGP